MGTIYSQILCYSSALKKKARSSGKNYSPPFLSLQTEYLIWHEPHPTVLLSRERVLFLAYVPYFEKGKQAYETTWLCQRGARQWREWLSERMSEWEWEPAGSLPSTGGVKSSRQNHISSKRRPQLKSCKTLERTKIWSWVPTGPETENECAGEGQQQFTGLDIALCVCVHVSTLPLLSNGLRTCLSSRCVATMR
jgi:hypothetical protein